MNTTELTTYKGLLSEIEGTPTYKGQELTSKQMKAFQKACEAECFVMDEFKRHGLDFNEKYVVVRNDRHHDYTDYDRMLEQAKSQEDLAGNYPMGGCVGDIISFIYDFQLETGFRDNLWDKFRDFVTTKSVLGFMVYRQVKIAAAQKTGKQPTTGSLRLENFNISFMLRAKHKDYPMEYEEIIGLYYTWESSGMFKTLLSNNPIFNQGDEYELRPLNPKE